MSKAKRVVGVATLLVSLLVMAVPALGQQRQNTIQRKRKGTSVTSATKPMTPGATTKTAVLAPTAAPLLLLRKKNSSVSSGIAASRLPVRGNAAIQQAPPRALDINRISAGVTGVKGLPMPIVPTTSTNPTSTTSTTTSTSAKGLLAPTAPKPIH